MSTQSDQHSVPRMRTSCGGFRRSEATNTQENHFDTYSVNDRCSKPFRIISKPTMILFPSPFSPVLAADKLEIQPRIHESKIASKPRYSWWWCSTTAYSQRGGSRTIHLSSYGFTRVGPISWSHPKRKWSPILRCVPLWKRYSHWASGRSFFDSVQYFHFL